MVGLFVEAPLIFSYSFLPSCAGSILILLNCAGASPQEAGFSGCSSLAPAQNEYSGGEGLGESLPRLCFCGFASLVKGVEAATTSAPRRPLMREMISSPGRIRGPQARRRLNKNPG